MNMMIPTDIKSGMELAEIMVTGKVMIPKHLQESKGDCLAVIVQASQWGLNPFVVAQKTFLINGKLGYEAQLVSAIINTNAPIKGRIKYDYIGDWDKYFKEGRKDEKGLGVRAYADLKDGGIVEKTVYLDTITVRNSTNWKNDPMQQLAYQAALRMSRQHFPEYILGVYVPEELEGIDAEVIDHSNAVPAQTAPVAITQKPVPLIKEVGDMLLEHFKTSGAIKDFAIATLELPADADLSGKWMQQLTEDDLIMLKSRVKELSQPKLPLE